MKVTKKTRLLKKLKHVTIDSLEVDATERFATLHVTNMEGVKGFTENMGIVSMPAKMRVGGGESVDTSIGATSGGNPLYATVPSDVRPGQEVTFELEVDPSKEDFFTEIVSKSATAT